MFSILFVTLVLSTLFLFVQSVVLLQGLKSIFAGEIPDDVFKFRRELNAIIVIIFLNVLVGDVIMNALGRQDIRYWITLSTLLLLYISTVPLVLYRKFSFDRRYATKSTKLIPRFERFFFLLFSIPCMTIYIDSIFFFGAFVDDY